jgi:hypothetical protein
MLLVAALAIAPSAHAATRTISLTTIAGHASQIAGSPVTIACDSPGTEGGHVQFDGVIHLDPWICDALTWMDRSAKSPLRCSPCSTRQPTSP